MPRLPDYSDAQLLADLTEAAGDLGEPLTVAAYDAWQRGHDRASPALLIRRFGSWNEACHRAGVATNKTRSTSRRWSDEDAVSAVARYLAASGGNGSFAGYSEWARGEEGAPSGSVLRQRYRWSEIKQRAMQR